MIYPNPGFPIYESVINFVGGVPVPIPLREESGFGFDLDLLEKKASAETKLIIINSPQNPTGGVLDVDQLGRIAERRAALSDPRPRRRDLQVVSLRRRVRLDHALSRAWRTSSIILDGFSKAYAMTGWRLGYGVMPTALAEHVTRLMVNSNSCTASFTQLAGIAALQGDQTPVAEMVAEFKRRRDIVVAGLNDLPGVSCRSPRGAFYVLPEREGAQAAVGGGGRDAAQRGRRRRPRRHRVRRARRGLPPAVVRQLRGEPRKALERMRPVCARLAGG